MLGTLVSVAIMTTLPFGLIWLAFLAYEWLQKDP